jgi:hypothetical protein
MGRPYTGADYTTSAYQLQVGDLRRRGVIVRGKTVRATMSWPDGGPTLDMESTWTDREQSLSLSFRLGEETWTQRIAIQTAPSPLQGELLYFLCPRSGKRCRKLFRAYHSHGFYHRTAFGYRLYYPQQASSTYKRADRQLLAAERKLATLQAKRRTSTYLGQPTRRAVRIAELQEEAERLEVLRWSPQFMPKAIRHLFPSLL